MTVWARVKGWLAGDDAEQGAESAEATSVEAPQPQAPQLEANEMAREEEVAARPAASVAVDGAPPTAESVLGAAASGDAPLERERVLAALEALAQETVGTFLVGQTPTLADVCLVPQLYAARRFGCDTAAFPTLERVEAACFAVSGVDATRPEKQPDAVSPA